MLRSMDWISSVGTHCRSMNLVHLKFSFKIFFVDRNYHAILEDSFEPHISKSLMGWSRMGSMVQIHLVLPLNKLMALVDSRYLC
jgi:hypothetical protein